MTALTNAEKQQAYRDRQKGDKGLKEVRGIWVDPVLHPPIKKYAADLALKREKLDQSKGKK